MLKEAKRRRWIEQSLARQSGRSTSELGARGEIFRCAIEETHLAKDQSAIGKIVFRYDAAGHQIGYWTYDGAGKLLGQTVAPSASPAKRK